MALAGVQRVSRGGALRGDDVFQRQTERGGELGVPPEQLALDVLDAALVPLHGLRALYAQVRRGELHLLLLLALRAGLGHAHGRDLRVQPRDLPAQPVVVLGNRLTRVARAGARAAQRRGSLQRLHERGEHSLRLRTRGTGRGHEQHGGVGPLDLQLRRRVVATQRRQRLARLVEASRGSVFRLLQVGHHRGELHEHGPCVRAVLDERGGGEEQLIDSAFQLGDVLGNLEEMLRLEDQVRGRRRARRAFEARRARPTVRGGRARQMRHVRRRRGRTAGDERGHGDAVHGVRGSAGRDARARGGAARL